MDVISSKRERRKKSKTIITTQRYYSLVIQSSMGIVGLIKDHMGEWFELQINWDWDGCSSQDPQPCWKGQKGRLSRNSEHGRGKEFNGWLFSKFSTTNVVTWWKLRRIFWWRPNQNLDSLGKSGARSLVPSLANDISFSQWILLIIFLIFYDQETFWEGHLCTIPTTPW